MPYSVRGLYDKKYCFTSDVMYKKYKRLIYTPSDSLARICKVNLSKAKKCGLICFPRIYFRGLIYCDQEPLWLLNVIEDVCYFLGVHTCIFRLSTRCKMFHSKVTYPFPQKSHECRASGCIPMLRNSFTLCWVGLVFNSSEAEMYGSRVRCM